MLSQSLKILCVLFGQHGKVRQAAKLEVTPGLASMEIYTAVASFIVERQHQRHVSLELQGVYLRIPVHGCSCKPMHVTWVPSCRACPILGIFHRESSESPSCSMMPSHVT